MKKVTRFWAILCCIAMIIQMFTIVPAVAASESAEVTYELSTTVEAGEKYIIVSNGYALTNKVAMSPLPTAVFHGIYRHYRDRRQNNL